jgi:hypothetical protein
MHFSYLSLLDRLGLSSKSLQRPAFVKSMKCDAICPHGHDRRKKRPISRAHGLINFIETKTKCRLLKKLDL